MNSLTDIKEYIAVSLLSFKTESIIDTTTIVVHTSSFSWTKHYPTITAFCELCLMVDVYFQSKIYFAVLIQYLFNIHLILVPCFCIMLVFLCLKSPSKVSQVCHIVFVTEAKILKTRIESLFIVSSTYNFYLNYEPLLHVLEKPAVPVHSFFG